MSDFELQVLANQEKLPLDKNIYAELWYVVRHKLTNKKYESTVCIQTIKDVEDWCIEHGYNLQEIHLLNYATVIEY